MEINKIIRKKKIQKILDFEHFYNNIKVNNSKLFKNRSQYIPETLSSRNFITNNKIHQNRSCDDFISNIKLKEKKEISTIENKNENDEKHNTDNFPNIINNDQNNKLKESIIIDGETSENKDKDFLNNNSVMMTLLPYIPSSKTNNSIYNNINNISSKNFKTENIEDKNLYNFHKQKIRIYLIESLESK